MARMVCGWGRRMETRMAPGLRAVEQLPVVLPVALAAFSVVAIFCLLIGHLESGLVWPLGLLAAVLAAAATAVAYPRRASTSKANLCNAVTLLGVLAWGGIMLPKTAQHLITNRDPGTYANAAVWLLHHDNLRIPAVHVFGAAPGITATSAGFFPGADGALLAQGQHLLPVLLGLMGRMVGLSPMLHLNILFGVTALLAIYAFARLLARPFWAMVITGALAASMPFIYFARDTYTEPLAATFTFGALAALWVAIESRRMSMWFLAGLVAAAGTLTRIDGYLTIIGLLGFLAVLLATTAKKERAVALRLTAAMLAGLAIVAVLGWLDVRYLSTSYYDSTKGQFYQELAGIVAIGIAGVLAVWFCWRQAGLLAWLDRRTKSWRAPAAALGVLLVTIALASRPLWYRGYNPDAGSGVQVRTRNYAELTTEWISWYIGPILAVCGVVGGMFAAARVLKGRNLLLLASVFVIMSTALVYLVKPSIAPDQIWASRRLVPVILPGVAVFGAMALDWLSHEYRRLQWWPVYVVLAAGILLVGPLITSRPLIRERDTALLAPVTDTCAALPANAAVLWLGTARTQLIQPTWGVCNIPAEGYGELFQGNNAPPAGVLAQAAGQAQANGYVPVVGMYASEAGNLVPAAERAQLTSVSTYAYQRLENSNISPPQRSITSVDSILLGYLHPDGTISSLRPAATNPKEQQP